MRIKIQLKYQGVSDLPVNYNYFLSSAIYNLLGFGKPEFANFLHDKGYNIEGKKYKLFTFAFRFDKYKIKNDRITLESPNVTLLVSSPLIDDFLGGIILGSFKKKELKLKVKDKLETFLIHQIEQLPLPNFKNEMKLILLNPLVLSTHEKREGYNGQYFLRFYDDAQIINNVFNGNLTNKYFAVKGNKYTGEGVKFQWDMNYIKNAVAKGKRITKRTVIFAGKNKIDIIGNLAPFTLKGDPELIKIGYEAGFGEKNSMGFGMAKNVI